MKNKTRIRKRKTVRAKVNYKTHPITGFYNDITIRYFLIKYY